MYPPKHFIHFALTAICGFGVFNVFPNTCLNQTIIKATIPHKTSVYVVLNGPVNNYISHADLTFIKVHIYLS